MQWRLLPGDLPIWTAVWRQFCRWRDSGVWRVVMERLLRRCREEAGRDPQPSAGLLDAQSVPSGRLGPREQVGVDGGKRIRGRKRHLLCDINGLPIAVGVTSAQPHDSRGGQTLLETAKPQLTRLTRCSPTPPASAWSDLPTGTRRRHRRHQETSRRDPLVRPAPATVAGRTDLRLARPQPQTPLRLRSDRDLVPNVRPHRRRRVHAQPATPEPMSHSRSSEGLFTGSQRDEHPLRLMQQLRHRMRGVLPGAIQPSRSRHPGARHPNRSDTNRTHRRLGERPGELPSSGPSAPQRWRVSSLRDDPERDPEVVRPPALRPIRADRQRVFVPGEVHIRNLRQPHARRHRQVRRLRHYRPRPEP